MDGKKRTKKNGRKKTDEKIGTEKNGNVLQCDSIHCKDKR